jgi:ubiquinone/menaquinone biosynthesis C-methylase UbiE
MSEAGLANDAAKTNALLGLIKPRLERSPARVLVVGCGSGCEAGILARAFGADTYGIDIGAEFAFDHAAASPATLRLMDAQALEFDDASFDLVYSFHALEHIPNFCEALREMSRVLRVGGTFCIGTPNKARFLGYLGSSAPLRTKIVWNLIDLSKRARGRWSNEQGAHAGFYAADLRNHCIDYFGETMEITDDYYLALYAGREKIIRRLTQMPLKYRIFPCVYVTLRKKLEPAGAGAPRNGADASFIASRPLSPSSTDRISPA